MSRLIDADRLLKRTKFYNLTNENRAIDEIDILHAPTIHAIPTDKIKKAFADENNQLDIADSFDYSIEYGIASILRIIDELAESE